MRTPAPADPAAIGIWVAVLRTHPGVSAFATLAATTESPAWVTRMPVTAVLSACVRLMAPYVLDRPRSWPASAQHVQEILNHLVRAGDDPRIGRVGLLRDDELGELVGDVGVG